MNDLLNLAMKAHGGLERWKQVRNMQAKVTLNGRGRRGAQPGSAPASGARNSTPTTPSITSNY